MAKARSKSAKPSGSSDGRPADRTLVSNRQALHDYLILETVEAGLSLVGTEVKSIRAGQRQSA